MTGTTIAQYEILEKLGQGGMGVVYKARDSKLDRFVALKFLPPHMSASEQDKSRFMQEAKAAAALSHANVCSIFDIQEHDGQMFIVMEFVEGATLRDRLTGMTMKQGIDIGVQIADGLAAAHEKGIVHRDIKPENIMIRKDGVAQIMDFGLAKLRESGSKITRLTKAGSTIGTAGYMSPEQVQGHDTDHRSDIFSFGVLLYELLTGELPFKGIHETALAYEIVNVDPAPMSSVKPEIDPNLDAIVLQCIEKDPRERNQSIAQVALDLKRFRRESSRQRLSRVTAARPAYASSPAGAMNSSEADSLRRNASRLPWIIAGVLGVVAAVALMLYMSKGTTAQITGAVRFSVFPPAKGAFDGFSPVISPDGKLLAFVAKDSTGSSMIWIRHLSREKAEQLKGTENASYPFWSPDGRYIGFFQNTKLKKIDASGGPAQTIADAPDGRGGAWSPSGVIIFTPNYGSGLSKVSEAGGNVTELTSLDTSRREETHRFPSFLPDGNHFIFFSRSSENLKSGICIGTLDGKESKLLVGTLSSGVYAPPGYLLYVTEKSLMAQPFDAAKGEFNGDPFPVTEDLAGNTRGNAFLSASNNGILVYIQGQIAGERQFIWYDRAGKVLEKVPNAGNIGDMSLAPDNKRFVYRRVDAQTGNQDLWIYDLTRHAESRFTFKPTTDDDPVWSPDGSRIAFDSNPDGVPNPFEKIASGAGTESQMLQSQLSTIPTDWSSDGRYLLLRQESRTTKTDILALPLFGDKKAFPVVQTESVEDMGHFSSDGKWILYQSNESGKYEVYIQAFPVSQGKWQVSVGGGGAPQWNKNGKEVFYFSPEKKLMAAEVRLSGSSVEVGIPKALFESSIESYDSPNRYAVASDGKRFLINSSAGTDSAVMLSVVLNWTEDFRKK